VARRGVEQLGGLGVSPLQPAQLAEPGERLGPPRRAPLGEGIRRSHEDALGVVEQAARP
jgi:hypothetical protein